MLGLLSDFAASDVRLNLDNLVFLILIVTLLRGVEALLGLGPVLLQTLWLIADNWESQAYFHEDFAFLWGAGA